jgi:hypothetical protein
MDDARRELLHILIDARDLLARSENCFDWSSWEDSDEAFREIDDLMATIEIDLLPSKLALSVLFAPTGPMQEVSISSGWADEFLALASRFDAASARVYDNASWLRRLLRGRWTLD